MNSQTSKKIVQSLRERDCRLEMRKERRLWGLRTRKRRKSPNSSSVHSLRSRQSLGRRVEALIAFLKTSDPWEREEEVQNDSVKVRWRVEIQGVRRTKFQRGEEITCNLKAWSKEGKGWIGSVWYTLLEGSLSYRSGTRRIEVDRFPSNLRGPGIREKN